MPQGLAEEDLLQEALLHWWRQRQRYELSKGASPATFLRRVVRSKLLDVARRDRAEKRGGGTVPLSLDAPLGSADDLSPADTVRDMRGGSSPDDAAQFNALRQHIADVERRLTARQRALLEALRDETPLTELSRRAGVNRSTVYADLARLRELFRSAGLEDFL